MAGQTPHETERVYGKWHNSIRDVLLPPIARRRSRLALTLAEHAYNHHVRLLPPEPLVVMQPQLTQVEGVGVVSNQIKHWFFTKAESIPCQLVLVSDDATLFNSQRFTRIKTKFRCCQILPYWRCCRQRDKRAPESCRWADFCRW